MKRLFSILVGLVMTLSPQAQRSEETDFRQNCATCHSIGGGKLTGPDLKGISEKRDKEWLVRYVTDPKTMLQSDPLAMELLREFRGVVMPNVPGMTAERARALIAFVDEESLKERSVFAGSQVSDRPLTPADLSEGEALFRGDKRLASGGPSCISCHQVEGLGGLGGGTLGPDLGDAFGRLGGRKALAAWLGAPATSVMQPIYSARPITEDEILPLVAFLQSKSTQGRPESFPYRLLMLAAGIAGLAVLFPLFDRMWRKRFRSVRGSLKPRGAGTEVRHGQ